MGAYTTSGTLAFPVASITDNGSTLTIQLSRATTEPVFNTTATIADENIVDVAAEYGDYLNEDGTYKYAVSITSNITRHWTDCGDIIAVDAIANTITISTDRLQNKDILIPESYTARNYFLFTPAAPNKGSYATGHYSVATGHTTQAIGSCSRADGYLTQALGNYSHAEGLTTMAAAQRAHAEGTSTIAAGTNSHAEGDSTQANHTNAHAEGSKTIAGGKNSHAEGDQTQAKGSSSHAEGQYSVASGTFSHAEGYNTQATGKQSHAQGFRTIAAGESQQTWGKYNVEDKENLYAHIVGGGTSNNARENIHTLDWKGNAFYKGDMTIRGNEVVASKNDLDTRASGIEQALQEQGAKLTTLPGEKGNNNAEKFNDLANNAATGICAHAEGSYATASGNYSHAEGGRTTAGGNYSHAEGQGTQALGPNSHAEGENSIVGTTGNGAHVEGKDNAAHGLLSHVEGQANQSESGARAAHVEGRDCIAKAAATYSHVEGRGNVSTTSMQHVQGKWNYLDADGKSGNYAHIVGGGTSATDRKNIHTLDWKGNAWFAGTVKVGADQKELATAEYVDEKINDISLVGKSIENYGEIFNDYENNMAFGLYSHAEGFSTLAGQERYSINTITAESWEVKDGPEYVFDYKALNLNVKFAGAKRGDTIAIVCDTTTYKTEITNITAEGYCQICEYMPGVNESNMELYNTILSLDTSTIKYAYLENGWAGSGDYSHAEGYYTSASGKASHAAGIHTKATAEAQTAIGQYNATNDNALFIVGNGKNIDERSNAFTVNKDGSVYIANSIKIKDRATSQVYSLYIENGELRMEVAE